MTWMSFNCILTSLYIPEFRLQVAIFGQCYYCVVLQADVHIYPLEHVILQYGPVSGLTCVPTHTMDNCNTHLKTLLVSDFGNQKLR